MLGRYLEGTVIVTGSMIYQKFTIIFEGQYTYITICVTCTKSTLCIYVFANTIHDNYIYPETNCVNGYEVTQSTALDPGDMV